MLILKWLLHHFQTGFPPAADRLETPLLPLLLKLSLGLRRCEWERNISTRPSRPNPQERSLKQATQKFLDPRVTSRPCNCSNHEFRDHQGSSPSPIVERGGFRQRIVKSPTQRITQRLPDITVLQQHQH
eukprot:2125872-Amphidinium_carterae.1